MTHHGFIRATVVRLAFAAGLAMLLGVPGIAATKNSPKAPAKLGTVTVTGSHIKRTDIETSQPIVRISHADLEHSGLSSVGDILQHLTSNGGGVYWLDRRAVP